jgi:N-acetyl sugar amidotransferase
MKTDNIEIKVCSRCVMDNLNDPSIKFESDGTCNYCNDSLKARNLVYFPNEEGKKRLDIMINNIKHDCIDRQYDCMMGISGGLDSAYTAYLGHKYGLRVLLLHIDDGFDAPVSTENIKKISDTYDFDLIIEKPDQNQFNDLVRSFILAGVPDIALLQDSILFSILYRVAVKYKIRYFLSGFNFALESITQSGMDYTDRVHIRDIHKKFGRIPFDGKLKLFSILDKRIKYGLFHRIHSLKPLDYIDFNAKNALKELEESCGFKDYGCKHCESILTKFLQVYYLPEKFSIDKRKSHLSSMIVSGQITRDEAIKSLSLPLYDEKSILSDIDFVLNRLELSRSEFDTIMAAPNRKHSEYRTSLVNKVAGMILQIRKQMLGY